MSRDSAQDEPIVDDLVESASLASENPSDKSRIVPAWIRIGTWLIALIALVILSPKVYEIWRQWSELKKRETAAANNLPIGYVDIYPRVSYAQRPRNWLHDEGEHTKLWCGWENNQHQWFTVSKGELTNYRFQHYQNGKEVVRPIDRPLTNLQGETAWTRLQESILVFPIEGQKQQRAYPHPVLARVEIANDEIDGEPLLIFFTAQRPAGQVVSIYDPGQGENRISMGVTGYRVNGSSLLFDRKTESLWLDQASIPGKKESDNTGLECIAGALKGQVLKRKTYIVAQTWGDWRDQHPEGQLVIGANRHPGSKEPIPGRYLRQD